MKRFSLLFLSLALAACSSPDPLSMVDPMIGSGGHGHVFVGASVPYGMVQLGPTQITRGWDWCSGYAYRDSIILGFSHTHLSGTGIGDLGDVMLLPFDPARKQYTDSLYDQNAKVSPRHLYARLDHSKEVVQPGFYSLEMPEYGVKVRLTAGTYTGYHEYSFSGDSSAVLLDLCTGIGWDSVKDWQVERVDERTLKGYRRSSGWAADQTVYFYAMFSQPFIFGEDEPLVAGTDSPYKARVLLFDTAREKKVHVVVGISPTSCQKALDNIGADTREGGDFGKNVARARGLWKRELDRIKIKPLDEKQGRIFYTALYHALIAPARFSDAGDSPRYTIFSLWDTYRAASPLYTIIDPERCSDFALSFMDIYKAQGKLPVWHLWGNETDCMIGNPGVITLGDYVLKGLYDNPGEALQAMDASFGVQGRGIPEFMQYGYVPYDCSETRETVSETLELAVAADAVKKVAGLQGDRTLYAKYDSLSKAYARHFDPESRFLRARSKDGSFRLPFDPFRAEHMADDYTEGNAWQYSFMVPHDVPGLIGTFGGDVAFLSKLDSLFVAEGYMGENHSDVTGLIGQYAHGNEPCHHVIYMYDYAGRPDKCQRLVRSVMDSLYFDAPDGLCGNEDVGQMSAWYVLSALGLYQVDPAGGDFYLGSPTVKEAVINGNFRIVAKDNSARNIYVKGVKLNGKALTEPHISYADIMAGGTLEFEMTDKAYEN